MSMQQVTEGQANPEVVINRNSQTLEHQSVYGQRQSAHSGLTWGYYGGRWGGFSVANGTHTLTNAADNYIVVLRSNGVPSVSTSTTNWNDSTNYARVYKITTAGSVVTATEDHRAGPGGVHGQSSAVGGSGTELRGLTFNSDTGSTAASDPGNGLFKWNNATQGSATAIYIDNQTADGVSLTTLWGALASTGRIYIQQSTDADRWQQWSYTAHADGTGYRNFTVTLEAKSTSDIQDDVECYFDFDEGASTGSVDADDVTYTPTTLADWDGSADPGDVEQALDQLAERVTDVEAGGGGGGGTKTYAVFTPMTSQPPASNFATLDTRNSIAVLNFDASTDESATWVSIMPEAASLGSGLLIRIHWMALSATSGTVRWGAQLERMNTDLDSDSFDTAETAGTATSGTSGIPAVTQITLTTIDSVAAGEMYRLKVYRDADGTSGTDDMTGDAQLIAVEVRSAA